MDDAYLQQLNEQLAITQRELDAVNAELQVLGYVEPEDHDEDGVPVHMEEANEALAAYNCDSVSYGVEWAHTEIAYFGKCQLVLAKDEHWSGKGARNYKSGVLENPTWLDVAMHADDAIACVKDPHHYCLEGVVNTGRTKYGGNVAVLELSMAS